MIWSYFLPAVNFSTAKEALGKERKKEVMSPSFYFSWKNKATGYIEKVRKIFHTTYFFQLIQRFFSFSLLYSIFMIVAISVN